jgi:hypothetical protein
MSDIVEGAMVDARARVIERVRQLVGRLTLEDLHELVGYAAALAARRVPTAPKVAPAPPEPLPLKRILTTKEILAETTGSRRSNE